MFDAYRTASAKHDWQGVLECLTPGGVKTSLVEAHMACLIHEHRPEVAKLLGKYNLNSQTVDEPYAARLRQKQQAAQGDSAQPSLDVLLYGEVLAEHLGKRAAQFYQEACQCTFGENSPVPLKIDNVTIRDNTALGTATFASVIEMISKVGPGPETKTQTKTTFTEPMRFKKVAGSWLLEPVVQ